MRMNKIILASGSPRRKQLLELAEISFEVIVCHTDEIYPPGLSPSNVAMHIAHNKAEVVQKNLSLKDNTQSSIIIGADTIVVLGDNIIGKPTDREDAIRILSLLSGKTHQVITGVCILSATEKIVFAEETSVTFHPLTVDQIEYYVEHYKPYDKAGAYAIQEWIGAIGIQSIKGDFYNVMGLPVSRVVGELDKLRRVEVV
jgi:septum formation protein